jgi:single-strand DNA-binding protein
MSNTNFGNEPELCFTTNTISGYLEHDPELRFLPSGTPVMNASIVVNDTCFRLVAYREIAELFATRLHKGSHVLVHGCLVYRSYKKDGQIQHITEIEVRQAELLDHKPA